MQVPQSLHRGVAAYQAGNLAEARRHLLQAVREQPQNDQAWAWLSKVAETTEERRRYLEQVVKINPANRTAGKALESMERRNWARAARTRILKDARRPLPGIVLAIIGVLNDLGK